MSNVPLPVPALSVAARACNPSNFGARAREVVFFAVVFLVVAAFFAVVFLVVVDVFFVAEVVFFDDDEAAFLEAAFSFITFVVAVEAAFFVLTESEVFAAMATPFRSVAQLVTVTARQIVVG